MILKCRNMSQNYLVIAKNSTPEGLQKYTFCESSLSPLSSKFKMGTIGIPSKVLVRHLGKICRNRVVFS